MRVYELHGENKDYTDFVRKRGYSFEQVPDWITLGRKPIVAICDLKGRYCGRIISNTILEILPNGSELDEITKEYITTNILKSIKTKKKRKK